MAEVTTKQAETDRATIEPRVSGRDKEEGTFTSEGISEAVRSVHMNRLLRQKEVEQMVGLSRASIYRLADLGVFPHPVQVGPRAVRWRLRDIERWISERPPTNGDGRKSSH